jgi:hypothetical protein
VREHSTTQRELAKGIVCGDEATVNIGFAQGKWEGS